MRRMLLGPPLYLGLYPLEGITVNNGFMRVTDIILRKLPCIFYLPLADVVCYKSLLQPHITNIFFVSEDACDDRFIPQAAVFGGYSSGI
ncbi:hypothetical protein SDC9_197160 [bioreactor metagenome]|uniref:Uncharacterized protein n=1 Tax=bioreactor metagenome TaxID=1076179 RepID=A0A645IGE5_9ZZZZ